MFPPSYNEFHAKLHVSFFLQVEDDHGLFFGAPMCHHAAVSCAREHRPACLSSGGGCCSLLSHQTAFVFSCCWRKTLLDIVTIICHLVSVFRSGRCFSVSWTDGMWAKHDMGMALWTTIVCVGMKTNVMGRKLRLLFSLPYFFIKNGNGSRKDGSENG